MAAAHIPKIALQIRHAIGHNRKWCILRTKTGRQDFLQDALP